MGCASAHKKDIPGGELGEQRGKVMSAGHEADKIPKAVKAPTNATKWALWKCNLGPPQALLCLSSCCFLQLYLDHCATLINLVISNEIVLQQARLGNQDGRLGD